jgi:hypothetical protein
MRIKTKDRYSIAEAYTKVQECECQAQSQQSSPERTDMILNNLVNLNNKAAELVSSIQRAVDSGEDVDEWVSEKIAVAANMIGTINDYYAKYKQQPNVNAAPVSMSSLSPLNSVDSNPIAIKIPIGASGGSMLEL